MQTPSWYVWGQFPGLPWFHSCYSYGLALELAGQAGVDIEHVAVDLKGDLQVIYMQGSEWENAGETYFQKVLADPAILGQTLRSIEDAADRLHAVNEKLRSLDVKNLPYRDLRHYFSLFHEAQHALWSIGMVPNLLELNQSLLSDYVRTSIGTTLTDKEWHELISPVDLSAAQYEELAIHQLAVEMKKHRVAPRDLARHPEFRKKLLAHHAAFCWVQFGWTGPALTLNDFITTLVILIDLPDLEEHTATLENNAESLMVKQLEIASSHALSPHQVLLLTLLRRLLFDKTYRMDALFEGYYSVEPLLKAIGRQHHLTLDQVYMLHGNEMLSQVESGALTGEIIDEMREFSAFIKEGNTLRLYRGKEAEEKMKPVLSTLAKATPTRVLKGQTAFLGTVTGAVRIVLTPADIPKVQEGDILVSHATEPSLLPAMKKAAAYVTDMGGLTCHAAIVARELHRPCIVGTKTATHVLKDGDVVEVNADTGTVTLLS